MGRGETGVLECDHHHLHVVDIVVVVAVVVASFRREECRVSPSEESPVLLTELKE